MDLKPPEVFSVLEKLIAAANPAGREAELCNHLIGQINRYQTILEYYGMGNYDCGVLARDALCAPAPEDRRMMVAQAASAKTPRQTDSDIDN